MFDEFTLIYKLSIIHYFELFPFFLIFHNPEILRCSEKRSLFCVNNAKIRVQI